MSLKRIKVITSHIGLSRWLDDARFIGYIPRHFEIPSPYSYSPVETVYLWQDKQVIKKEVFHKRFEIFEIPKSEPIFVEEEQAMKAAGF